MSIAPARSEVTPEQFLVLPDAIGFELVDGEIRERPMSSLSSWVGTRLVIRLGSFVEARNLGWVFSSDNGYQCFPDSPRTLRRPDVSFVRLDRLAAEEIQDGWLRVVPDLVVEVVSPNDLSYEVEQKLEEYLRVGVPLIWVVFPPTRSIRVLRGDGSMTILRNGDELLGEAIIPGFQCPVVDLFLPVSFQPTANNPA